MNKNTSILLVVCAFILQLTIMPRCALFGSFPDLILMAVVLAVLSCPWRFALMLSIAAGALEDALGVYPLGIHTLLFPLWAFTVAQAAKRFSIDTNGNRSVLVFAVCLLHAVAMRVFSLYLGAAVPLGVGVRIALWGSFYTAAASRAVLRLASRR